MMKYEEPILIVVEFDEQDVLTTSAGQLTNGGAGGQNGYNWTDWF